MNTFPLELATPRTDEEIVEQTNELARICLKYLGSGFHAPEGFRFYEARMNPRAEKAWAWACEIMELMTATDSNDALSGIDTSRPIWEDVAKAENWQIVPASSGHGLILDWIKTPVGVLDRTERWEWVWEKAEAGNAPHVAALAYLKENGLREWKGIRDHMKQMATIKRLRELAESDDEVIRNLATEALNRIPVHQHHAADRRSANLAATN